MSRLWILCCIALLSCGLIWVGDGDAPTYDSPVVCFNFNTAAATQTDGCGADDDGTFETTQATHSATGGPVGNDGYYTWSVVDGTQLEVADSARFDDITTNNFTVSVWIRTTQTSEGHVVASNNDASGHDFVLGVSGGTTWVEATASRTYHPPINDDQWHMMTYTREGDTANVYVDGFFAGTEQAGGDPASQTRWSIGQEWDNATPSNFYFGLVDDARFYNGSLSAEEIAALVQ